MISLVIAIAELLVVVAVALAAVLLNTIDARGFIASATVGLAIMFGGGFQWFMLVAVFFILGVIFTLYKYGYKRRIGVAQRRGGARNWPHILANGGLASIVALMNLFGPSVSLGALFLGALSTSAADTAATELGILYPSRPRLITHPSKAVPPGTSGGVSPLGFVGAALASAVIGFLGIPLGILPNPYLPVPIAIVGGLGGAIADSLMGAVIQRKGYCAICGKPTEALSHCGTRTRTTGGLPFVENNIVNVLSTVVGALVSLAILLSVTAI
jgi:uncharacterized protein (TIGR00297 family)